MPDKLTYQEMEQRIRALEQECSTHQGFTRDLRESEERFKALSNAAFSGILIHDNGLILDCNQGLADMTGFTPAELIGMNGLRLIAPDSLDLVLKNIGNGYDRRYEVEGLRKDGSVYPLAIKGKNVPYMGREARVIEFLDITERKQAEEERSRLEMQLQQAQKMEAIGTLAGGIAHDFNNLLAVIMGNAELAEDSCQPETERARNIEQIMKASVRAKNLVAQILDFSRQTDAVPVPLSIAPLIEESLKMLRSSLPATISITRDIETECGQVLADPTQIHQILMNLGTNAYHAMEPAGGVLSVVLRGVLIAVDDATRLAVEPGTYVELVVSDTGCGMSPELIERVFDPYYTTKEMGKGTGMGLAIIHGIMTKYGGSILATSQLGEGSAFHVYFPVVERDALADSRRRQPVPRGSERILLVDDEEALCKMGQNILERLGYDVVAEQSSIEALALFKRDPDGFALVVTDQTMPFMTGSELAGRLMEIRSDIPVILCTGYSDIVDEKSAKEMGIREFALKPLANASLGLLVRRMLDAR